MRGKKRAPSVTAASPCPLMCLCLIFGRSREDRRTVTAHARSILALIALSIRVGPRGMCNVGSCALGCDWDPEDSVKTNRDEIVLVVMATATFPSKALEKLLFFSFSLTLFGKWMSQAKNIVLMVGLERIHFVSLFMAQFVSMPIMEYLEYRSAVYFSKQGFYACKVLCLIPMMFYS